MDYLTAFIFSKNKISNLFEKIIRLYSKFPYICNISISYIMKIKDGFKGELSIVLPKAIIRLMKDDPLASSIYITDIGYYPKASNHYRSREKPIDEYVFIYCIDGKGWFEIKGKHYEVRANQYFILPAGISTLCRRRNNPMDHLLDSFWRLIGPILCSQLY